MHIVIAGLTALIAFGACGADAGERADEDAGTDASTPEDAGTDADVSVSGRIRECPTSVSDEVLVCEVALDCVVREECCCGECTPQTTCRCTPGGVLVCDEIQDICFWTMCSEGCGPDEARTPLGCSACRGKAVDDLAAAVATIDAGRDACEHDEDCTLLTTNLTCADTCDRVVSVSALGAAEATVASLQETWCPELERICFANTQPCPERVARCDAGHCVATTPCDPLFVEAGTACDDHDPCTDDDQCNLGACAGHAHVCEDDGNPCTAERCIGGSCLQTPTDGACDPACSITGTCESGTCNATGMPGWTRTFSAFTPERPVAVVPDGDDMLLLAKGSYRAVSGLGVLGEVVDAPALVGLMDAVVDPDEGIVVLVEDEGTWFVRRLDAAMGSTTSTVIDPGDRIIRGARIAASATVIAAAVRATDGPFLTLGGTRYDLVGERVDRDAQPAVTRTNDGFAVVMANTDGTSTVRFVSDTLGPPLFAQIAGARAIGAFGDDVLIFGEGLARVSRSGETLWLDYPGPIAAYADGALISGFQATRLMQLDGDGAVVTSVPMEPSEAIVLTSMLVPEGLVIVSRDSNTIIVRRATGWSACTTADCTPAGCAPPL